MIPIIVIAIICVFFYFYLTSNFSHWEKLRIPHPSPHFLFGNIKDVLYQKSTFFQVFDKVYRKYRDLPYVGVYIVRSPGLLIRDPKIIKDIVQNEFSSFHDNDRFVDEKTDPIFGGNPVTNKGDQWKTRRALHTVQFSSGKIKFMYAQVAQGGDKMNKFISDQINTHGECTIKAIELASKYTIYNVGNCALGIDSKTFDDDNAELRDMGRKILEPNFYNGFKQSLVFFMPSLANFLTVRLIPHEVTQKFRKLVRENLEYRKQNGIVRNDFFESIQEHKGQKSSIDEMVVQIGGLFLDGFGTNSTVINFIVYELAVNPDVQEKLQEEIDKYLSEQDGRIPYEVFQEMPYVDAVVSEGLRKYPPLGDLFKLSTRRYTFPPVSESGKPLTIEPNTTVIIPLISIQRDEKYFPDPERFDPTRFLNGNKDNIEKCTYMPFNEGPRTCLGKRFALMQTKVMLLKLFSQFDVRLNPKTKLPIEFDVQSFLLAPKGGIWIDIHKRKLKNN